MKSQSLIGRVKPELATTISRELRSFKKNVSYYSRYYSFPLAVIGIFAGVATVMFVVASIVTVKNNNIMHQQAKLYHYAVGSTVKCNSHGDGNIDGGNPLTDGNGWFDCKVESVTPDNYYYTTSYYNPKSHKQETYKFQIQYVSNK